MTNPDVDDIFKDFQYKVKGKKEIKEVPKEPVKQLIDEEEEAPKQQPARQEKILPKKIPNYEKIGYIAIILVLAAYIGIDWMDYHAEDNIGKDEKKEVKVKAVANQSVKNETSSSKEEAVINTTTEKKDENLGKSEAEAEPSGTVTITLDEVYTSISTSLNDTGSINKIDFTIFNGKSKILNPLVSVYAYDSEADPSWQTTSRGDYKRAGIESGKSFSGSISLSPKTFKNLKLKKQVRLSLNGTEEGFITAVSQEITIS